MFLRTNAGVRCLRLYALLLAAAVWLASPAWAQFNKGPTPEGAATIISLVGRVDVMNDSTPWAVEIGSWVKPGQMVVTGPDGGAIFRLGDGSTFEIYANSRVIFRANPGDWRELLDVFLGNIKVHIQKLGGQPNHNRVRTPTAVISVRGTTFNVNVEDDGDTTLVEVVEGLVDVENVLPGSKKVSLTDGQSIRVYKNVPLAQRNIDKGSVAQQVARGMAQVLYEVMIGRQRGPSGSAGPASTGGTGGGTVGDTRAPDPPPPPPPPPPPK